MHNEAIHHIGLNNNEIKAYLFLLEKGLSPVSAVATATKIKRSNLYNVMAGLEEKGAVVKTVKAGVTHFKATNPRQLLALAEQNEEQIRHHKEALELALPSLLSIYQLSGGKPTIRYYEGIDGLQKIYDDIIRTGQDIRLVRSVFDNAATEMKKRIERQIERQVKAGIRAFILAPVLPIPEETLRRKDAENLVERRSMPRETFSLPAQIILYGNCVALTDFSQGETIVSTVIENASITETMCVIFDQLWDKAEE